MGHHNKLQIAINGLTLAICLSLAVVFFLVNTVLGYIISALLFGFSFYAGLYFYRILWLHNWGRPLSEEKKLKLKQYQKQMGDYQRYNLYNRIYRFADATELDYQVEKAKEEQKKNRR